MSDTTYTPANSAYKDPEVGDLEEKVNRLVESRRRYERQWYLNENFYHNKHHMIVNRVTGTVERMRAQPGQVYRPIPIAKKKVDDMATVILGAGLRWKGKASLNDQGQIDDVTTYAAKRTNDWLQHFFEENDLRQKQADLVTNALKMPYSYWWFGYDPVEDEFTCDNGDAFDILFDADLTLENFQLSSMVARRFRLDLKKVKANPYYENTDDLKEEDKWSASEAKERISSEQYGIHKGGVLLTEIWEKDSLTEDLAKQIIRYENQKGYFDPNEKEPGPAQPITDDQGNPVTDQNGQMMMQPGKPQKTTHWVESLPIGSTVMCISTISQGKLLRRDYCPFNLYPCALYSPYTGKLNRPAVIEMLMPTNKSYDSLIADLEMWMHLINRGRRLEHANTNVTRKSDELGEVIKWSGPAEPKYENPPAPPQILLATIQTLDRIMNTTTVYGSEASMYAQGGRGYKTMEAIKAMDSQSMSIPTLNLATFMQNAGQVLLMLADYYLDHKKTIYKSNKKTGEADYFDIIGKRAAKTLAFQMRYGNVTDPQDRPVIIDASMKVTVEVESALAYTEEAKKDFFMQLLSNQAITPQFVLEQLIDDNDAVAAELDRLQQKQNEQNPSMIDTPDFQNIDPSIQQMAVQDAQNKNLSMPRSIQTKQGGSVKKHYTNTQN